MSPSRSQFGANAPSAFRRFALLADRSARLDFLNVFGSVWDLACADRVDLDVADFLASLKREFGERLHVAAHGDDKAVHRIAHAVGLIMDRFLPALTESLQFGQ